jgi:hypothetical protein
MSYTYPEKLQAFDDMLATPTLTAEERYWVEKMKELLVQGVFHDTWNRLQEQNPSLVNSILTAVYKVRTRLRTNA